MNVDPAMAILSAAGAARRDALRAQLVRRVGWRGRRRRGAQAVLALCAAILGYHAISPVMPVGPRELPTAATTPVAAPAPSWRIIDDDPTVLARCTAPPVPSQVEFLDDDGLQRQLVQAGRTPAMARAGERLIVLAKADDWTLAP